MVAWEPTKPLQEPKAGKIKGCVELPASTPPTLHFFFAFPLCLEGVISAAEAMQCGKSFPESMANFQALPTLGHMATAGTLSPSDADTNLPLSLPKTSL